MKKNIFQKEAKKAFLIELEELKAFSKSKNFNVEELCSNISNCKGKVFITGVGKSGHIANKIAATLSSTGPPSFFIHPAEALHGDLGMVEKKDAILAISKSGESKEICDLIPAIKLKKINLYSITENINSTIAQASKTHILVKVKREACPNGLAPTSSTTVTLALGDAIAVALLKAKGFSSEDFAKSHPGGKRPGPVAAARGASCRVRTPPEVMPVTSRGSSLRLRASRLIMSCRSHSSLNVP